MEAMCEFAAVRIKLSDTNIEPQVRTSLDQKKVKRLAGSLQEVGQQTPVQLRRTDDGRLVVVEGHYRCAAAAALGWIEILAVIDESPATSVETRSVQLATQCRFALNPMERAVAYDAQLRESGMTAAKLAAICGTSESQVSRLRALVAIDPELQKLVAEGKLGPSTALQLSQIADKQQYAELLHRAKAGSLTRAVVEKAARSPGRRRRPHKSGGAAKRVIRLDRGCTLRIGAGLRSTGELVEVLVRGLEAIREAQTRGEEPAWLSLGRQASNGQVSA
ncbi:MAG: ParB/RepB/Spo0J family partition protein [Phycisphaerales bacterium]